MRGGLLSLALLLAAVTARAESYPARPIHIVVPYAPGGLSDVVARKLGGALGEALGQSVVVDNRPGASAIIGCELVARAAPDGYTLLMISSGNLTTNPSLFATLPYDTLRDFAPVSNIGYAAYLLDVHPSLPVHTVAELVALAKARPATLDASIPGSGAGGHLALELFMHLSGTRFNEIPFKGAGPALADTLAGQTQLIMDALPTSLPHVRAGAIRALAVSSAVRSPLLPELPTIAEAGLPGYDYAVYNGLLAPAGTPAAIVERLQRETAQLAGGAAMRTAFQDVGLTLTASTPAEFARYIRAETAKWAGIIKQAAIQPQ